MRERGSMVVVATTCAIVACGARTGLESGGTTTSSNDASVDATSDVFADGVVIDSGIADAAGCPPVPVAWTESVVEDSTTSYAIAADDRCGVAVVSADASNALDVATLDEHGAWTHSPLGVSGLVVAATVAGSTLHVLFFEGTSLHYVARRDSVLGAPEIVDSLGLAHGEMAVDASGAVHAIYPAVNGTLSDLHYAVRRDAGWAVEQVDARQSFEPSLSLAPDGKVFVSYEYVNNSEDHACVLATRGDGGWSLLDLPRVDDFFSSDPCTVRVAHDGVVHLAYGAYSPSAPPGPWLRHAYGSFDSLHFENVEVLASFGDDLGSASLDGAGALHVAYRSKDGSPLRVAVLRPPAAPAIETVSSEDSQGLRVVVDRAGVTNVLSYRAGRLVVSRHGP